MLVLVLRHVHRDGVEQPAERMRLTVRDLIQKLVHEPDHLTVVLLTFQRTQPDRNTALNDNVNIFMFRTLRRRKSSRTNACEPTILMIT